MVKGHTVKYWKNETDWDVAVVIQELDNNVRNLDVTDSSTGVHRLEVSVPKRDLAAGDKRGRTWSEL